MTFPTMYWYSEYINVILADPLTCQNMSMNPHPAAVKYMLEHPEKINWELFSMNTNQQAVEYMLGSSGDPNNRFWCGFSANKNQQAVEYMLQHPEKIVWSCFSRNSNQHAVEYLLGNLGNPNHQHLEKNLLGFFSIKQKPQNLIYSIQHLEEIQAAFDDGLFEE